MTTTYGADGYGNVASIQKPNGKTTTFTYSWGQVQRTTTPEYVITRQVNPNGTIASETEAGRTTAYVYDELSRVIRTRPPGYPGAAEEIEMTYDNVGGAWVRTRRGTSVTETRLDGFGRPIETTNSVGVRTRTEYDAEARVVKEGYPVETGAPDLWTHIEYDVLGRVTRRINPDGSMRQRHTASTATGCRASPSATRRIARPCRRGCRSAIPMMRGW